MRDCFFLFWGAFIVRLFVPLQPGLPTYLLLPIGVVAVPVAFLVLWLCRSSRIAAASGEDRYWAFMTFFVLTVIEFFAGVARQGAAIGGLAFWLSVLGCAVFQIRAAVFVARRS